MNLLNQKFSGKMVFIKIIKIVLEFCYLGILQNTISEVSELICEKKNDYYHQLARKLIDPTTSCKKYW